MVREPADQQAGRAEPAEELHGVMQVEPGASYGIGWKIFTGSMLLLTSIVTTIAGVAGIMDEDSGLEPWGWIALVIGFAVALAAFGVFWGTMWARVIGVVASGLDVLIHIRFWTEYPWLSAIAIVLNALVIYGLVVRVRPLTREQLAALEGRQIR
jgi:hypothetical protein